MNYVRNASVNYVRNTYVRNIYVRNAWDLPLANLNHDFKFWLEGTRNYFFSFLYLFWPLPRICLFSANFWYKIQIYWYKWHKVWFYLHESWSQTAIKGAKNYLKYQQVFFGGPGLTVQRSNYFLQTMIHSLETALCVTCSTHKNVCKLDK